MDEGGHEGLGVENQKTKDKRTKNQKKEQKTLFFVRAEIKKQICWKASKKIGGQAIRK
jgi:hypothetical protein